MTIDGYALLLLTQADIMSYHKMAEEAQAARDKIISLEPECKDDIGIIAFDIEGMPVGEPL